MSKNAELGTLCFLSFSILIGCLVFCRGYLLNRQVISEKSPPCHWRDATGTLSEPLGAFQLQHNLSSVPWCNPRPIYSKVILVLLDALRFDFIHRMPFLSSILAKGEKDSEVEDGRPVSGTSSCAFKFLADPPTTTMQRLKALMTGTMPTFIDASANFNSYEVEEDNLIFQLTSAKKRIAFLGDDTWLSLFPRSLFTSPYVEAHPSFNAWDLDTVDRAVNTSIYRLLGLSEREDWDILIAHILGVDHCGHRFGPSHPEMKRKLDESDSTIEHIFNTMNHDTLLIVFGDHGMTKTGDHGGDSVAETESALIFLAKQLKRDKVTNPAFQCRSKIQSPQPVSQIDLVSTLSTMLGLPIPFSSIGQLVPNFLANKLYSDAIAANVAQVSRYIQRYPSISNDNLTSIFNEVEEAFQVYQSMKSPETREALHKLAKEYLTLVRSQAVLTWTQFDLSSIFWGISITILALVALVLYLSRLPGSQGRLFLILSSFGLVSVLINFAVGPNFGLIGMKVSTSLGLSLFLLVHLTSRVRVSVKPPPEEKKKGRVKVSIAKSSFQFSEVIALVLYALSCLAVFSNSFVINEGYVIGSVLTSVAFILVMTDSSKKNRAGVGSVPNTSNKQCRGLLNGTNVYLSKMRIRCSWIGFLVLALIIRTTQLFFRCREELTECEEIFLLHKHLASLPADWVVHKFVRYGAALLSLAVFVVSFREWMMSRSCINSSRPASVIGKYVPSVLVVLTCVFWALEGLPFTVPNMISIRPLFNYFPLVFQCLTIISVGVIWVKPLCCIGTIRAYSRARRIWPTRTSENNVKNTAFPTCATNACTKGHMVDNNVERNGSSSNGVREGEGSLHTSLDTEDKVARHFSMPDTMSEDVFSSSLLVHSVLVTLLLVQVSTAGITPAITLIPYTCISLLAIYGDASSSGSWSLAVMWTLSSQYFFYGTGHQPVFSAIPWDSAFIGGNDNLGGAAGAESWINWVRPALSVLGNLHASQIIFAMTLPLTTVWRSSEMPETLLGPNEKRKAYVMAGKVVALHALKLLACMLCAALHKRHLMVWKIFAPKLIFETISFIVTYTCTLVSLLFLTRLNYLYQGVVAAERFHLHRLLKP